MRRYQVAFPLSECLLVLCPCPAKDECDHTIWKTPVIVGSSLCMQHMPCMLAEVSMVQSRRRTTHGWECLSVIPCYLEEFDGTVEKTVVRTLGVLQLAEAVHRFVTTSGDRVALELCCQRLELCCRAENPNCCKWYSCPSDMAMVIVLHRVLQGLGQFGLEIILLLNVDVPVLPVYLDGCARRQMQVMVIPLASVENNPERVRIHSGAQRLLSGSKKIGGDPMGQRLGEARSKSWFHFAPCRYTLLRCLRTSWHSRLGAPGTGGGMASRGGGGSLDRGPGELERRVALMCWNGWLESRRVPSITRIVSRCGKPDHWLTWHILGVGLG